MALPKFLTNAISPLTSAFQAVHKNTTKSQKDQVTPLTQTKENKPLVQKTTKETVQQKAQKQAAVSTPTKNTVTQQKPDTSNNAVYEQLALEQYNTANNIPQVDTPNIQAPSVDTTTPTPVPTVSAEQITASDSENALKALQEAYARTLQTSDEELRLQQELSDYQKALNLGLEAEEGTGRDRVLSLVRGRQEKLLNQGNANIQNLQDRLAIENARRIAEQNAAQFNLQTEEARQQRAAEQSRPFEFGGNLVRLNPETGELDTIAKGPEEAVKPITLGEGQSLVNPLTGEILFTSPKTTDPIQQQKQLLEIQKLQQELGGDLSSGILNNDQLDRLHKTKQFNALLSTETFNSQLQRYMDKVAEYGRAGALQPQQKKDLQNLYSELSTTWKTLKELGAITGPDLELMNRAIPDATSVGFLGINNILGAGTGDRIIETLKMAQKNIALDALSQYRMLIQQNPAYSQSDYVNERIMPFITSDILSAEDVANATNFPLSEVEEARKAGYDDATLKAFILTPSFSNDLSTSLNGFGNFNAPVNLPKENSQAQSVLGMGTITGYGSKLWKQGLDFVLPGGKNAEVKIPTSFTVLALEPAAKTGGFGNRARIRFPDGQELWISHLDTFNKLQPGQTYGAGTVIGKQGNTGNTYGPTGIHLDLTMPKAGGGYYTAQEVAKYLGIGSKTA